MRTGDLRPHLLAILEPDATPDLAVVVTTIDNRGYPHLSLLSTFELFLLNETLFSVLQPGSTAASNLSARSKGALAFFLPAAVYYLKFGAREVLQLDDGIVFSLAPDSCKRDEPPHPEEGARLAHGLLFREEPQSRERRMARRDRVTAALRGRL